MQETIEINLCGYMDNWNQLSSEYGLGYLFKVKTNVGNFNIKVVSIMFQISLFAVLGDYTIMQLTTDLQHVIRCIKCNGNIKVLNIEPFDSIPTITCSKTVEAKFPTLTKVWNNVNTFKILLDDQGNVIGCMKPNFKIVDFDETNSVHTQYLVNNVSCDIVK